MTGLTASSMAQVPRAPIEQIDRPLEQRRVFPDFRREVEPPVFVLPPVVPQAGQPALSSAMRVRVTRIRLVGHTAFSDQELGALAAPFENRELGNEDLEELRNRITRHYVNAGYINSGALIPDQRVADGVITLQIVEGRLAEIEIAGEHRFHPDFLRSRLALGAGPPLNVNRLQEQMQIMLLNPQIERINAELGPGMRPGEGTLKARIDGGRPALVNLSVANNRSPSVGGVRAELQGTAQNLLGRGENLSLRAGRTGGLDDYGVSFTMPVSVRDTSLSLRYDKNDSTVIEEPFNRLDIRSKSETLEIGIMHPFMRTPEKEISGRALLSNRHSETFLLGQPFSFTPGLEDGKSTVSALRLSLDWIDRGQDRVLAVRSSFNFGIDRFGATIKSGGTPDSRFASWLGQFQWAKRLAKDQGQWVFRADAQLSDRGLLPSEKFAVGGADTVRGYRENTMVRDSGWVASLEYRRPLARLPIAALGDDSNDGILHWTVFADAGKAWDRNDGAAANGIRSAGPGLRWEITRDFQAQIYWGIALTDTGNPKRDLQDRGIHIKVALQKPF